VSVLTGFLGSGKTTLLNRVLRSPAWSDTAVIVNELGEIALDHLLLETSSDNVQVLSSGCLCCTLQGDLRATLADLFVRRVNGKVPRFARAIVETTGLADPGPVANALVSDALLRAEYRFSAIATTVDAMHGLSQIEQYAEASRQVALADVLILTKGDLVAAADAATVARRLGELNPAATTVTSVRGDLEPGLLFPDAASELPRGAQPGLFGGAGGYSGLRSTRHTAAQAFSFVIEHPVHWSGLAAWMAYAAEKFGERLLRVKGIFSVADEATPVAIHGIGRFFHPPERLAGRAQPEAVSHLVCIARDVDEAELAESLKLLDKESATNGF
jgi:G3E family GTPase